MIFRAIFWIAVVAVLMPKEPDLGLGRPGVAGSNSLVSAITSMVQPSQPSCKDAMVQCVAAASMVGQISKMTGRTLSDVKAEIEEAKREREARRHG